MNSKRAELTPSKVSSVIFQTSIPTLPPKFASQTPWANQKELSCVVCCCCYCQVFTIRVQALHLLRSAQVPQIQIQILRHRSVVWCLHLWLHLLFNFICCWCCCRCTPFSNSSGVNFLCHDKTHTSMHTDNNERAQVGIKNKIRNARQQYSVLSWDPNPDPDPSEDVVAIRVGD